jgi:hypothetical protein
MLSKKAVKASGFPSFGAGFPVNQERSRWNIVPSRSDYQLDALLVRAYVDFGLDEGDLFSLRCPSAAAKSTTTVTAFATAHTRLSRRWTGNTGLYKTASAPNTHDQPRFPFS